MKHRSRTAGSKAVTLAQPLGQYGNGILEVIISMYRRNCPADDIYVIVVGEIRPLRACLVQWPKMMAFAIGIALDGVDGTQTSVPHNDSRTRIV